MAQPAKIQADGYIPFRLRFRAWWHGLEPDALVKNADPVARPRPEAIQVDHVPLAEESQAARLALLQKLWGDGCLEPGGAAYTLYLIKPLAPTPDKSVLDLAAGLCGGAKCVSEKYGLWVDAMEPDPDLLAAAEAFCEHRGLSKKIKLSGYDPVTLKLPKKKLDSIFARERFYLFPDKPPVLRAIRDGLKPGGQLVFTDLVLADRRAKNEAVEKWREAVPAKTYLWTMKEYEETLAELRLDVRVFADNTDTWRSHIMRGWSKLVDGLGDDMPSRAFVDVLMTEAELWHDQVQALDSGQLRFLRVHAIHHGNAIRPMSGW